MEITNIFISRFIVRLIITKSKVYWEVRYMRYNNITNNFPALFTRIQSTFREEKNQLQRKTKKITQG